MNHFSYFETHFPCWLGGFWLSGGVGGPVHNATMRSILDLVVPSYCAGCDAPATRWCAECAGSFGVVAVRRPGVSAYALAQYSGAARRAVLAYKEKGRRELAAV